MMSELALFDQVIDRSAMNSDKWDKYSNDVIPMWVADMDFDAPACVKTALQNRIQQGVFGYTHIPKALVAAIQTHLQTSYDWPISGTHLVHLPGLVCALHLSVQTFSLPGDTIVVPGPVYYHLTKAPEMAGRNLLSIKMTLQEGRWLPDWQAFEKACALSDSKMILLCNPHNPGGTVYRREELEVIHGLAQKYDLLVVSDEIHCDLILDDITHVPFASLNQDAAQRTITLMAPSKTYNLAGLGYAFAVIENTHLRQRFNQGRAGLIPVPNMLGLTAAQAAYEEGQVWHHSLITYLRTNRDYIVERLADTPLTVSHLEATYLAWIDASNLPVEDAYAFFLEAGVGVSPGKDFGDANFIRLNFGCSMSVLQQALYRIENAIRVLQKR
ncbi:PatB family C-S lyase [Marinomonas sp. THO17]|uniref:MalY/PatB family protein n=1 Tax=Marinomonas sp. THO17 TaxID=3149048 RepID=UPI00336C0616